jgi:hypothetical protein|tara:strand:+ start:337 stop:858 length:522 start_codon:yes stop_codon:yes gene_type:complete
MSWQGQMTTVVRHLVNDTDSASYKFSDDRLETSILVAAQLVISETEFTNSYEINVEGCGLSPDPTDSGTKDNDFVALVCLKTACIILGGDIRSESGNAISIKDGPSAIDLRGVTQTLALLYKDMCEKYENMLFAYESGESSVNGQAILSPYSPGSDLITRNGIDHRSGGYLNY